MGKDADWWLQEGGHVAGYNRVGQQALPEHPQGRRGLCRRLSFRDRDLRNGFYDPETKDHGGLPIDGLGRRVRRRRRGPRADLWYRVGDSSL